MKTPDKNSKRSKRRANRGFVDLETSSRKHRRAYGRRSRACVLNGRHLEPGAKDLVQPGPGTNIWTHTAGGSLNFHN
jgi:hypothetical protein